MKTIRLSLIAMMAFLLTAITPLHGQKLKPDAVPEEVKQTMDFEYSNVKILYWELSDGVYIATSKRTIHPANAISPKTGNGKRPYILCRAPSCPLPSRTM